MPKFAANISHLFVELPYLDRFDAAAAAGFSAVEILFPYEFHATETKRALVKNGLELVLINAPPPSYSGATPGFAAIPGGEQRFQHDVRRVLRYCEVFRNRLVHVMSGATDAPDAQATMVRNLQWLADAAPSQGFCIEPLNQDDQPGYFLSDYGLAIDILDAVDRPNVGLQFDTYHAHRIHGDAGAVWDTYGARAHHVQIGAPPDRGPPVQCDFFDFPAFFDLLDADGYDGWVSAEYTPGASTPSTLGWMR